MQVQERIIAKLGEAFDLEHLEVFNDSDRHAGPATESHFRVVAVSDSFEGLSLVKRHQSFYKVLQSELDGVVHALALHLFTPLEWKEQGANAPDSPECSK